MNRVKKAFWYVFVVGVLGVVALLFTCNYLVSSNAEGRLYTDIDSVPQSEFGLLLGTTPQTRIGHRPNQFFQFRIEAAEKLYKAGKIKNILISGDENSLDGVNEVECMRDSLVAHGIPENAILLDGKGFRTLDSVVRMSKVFGFKTFTIISQRFHNERALYLAEHLGLDVKDLHAYNAKGPSSVVSIITYVREYFARVKMFLDIWTDKQPLSLENTEPLIMQIPMGGYDDETFWRDINTIDAHDEQDTIVGNFTGNGLDTLYVEMVENPKYTVHNDDLEQMYIYYLSSPNKNIPKIELYGCDAASPKLVNEGDLDGNGTCEVGYIHTWTMSQWRYYRIFTLVKNEWRYLVEGDYLDTPEWFRHSGVEVAEPGKQKGTVLIHHYYESYDEITEEKIEEIRDTIVIPTFNRIED